MRRMWDRAKAFVLQMGWTEVDVSIRLPSGERRNVLLLWQDPLRPDRGPVYLHEAEAIADRRLDVVKSVMES